MKMASQQDVHVPKGHMPKLTLLFFSALKVEMDGLTGRIKFDSLGFRTDFDLEIVELRKDGLFKVGTWNTLTGTNYTRNYTEAYSDVIESLGNRTLTITTIRVCKCMLTRFTIHER